MSAYSSITMIGCGNMGGAMLRSWLDNNIISRVNIIKPSPPEKSILEDERVTYYQSINEVDVLSRVVVLAVKPQMLETALDIIKGKLPNNPIILSMLAGKTIRSIEKELPPGTEVYRSMPNTPAAIGEGANVVCSGGHHTQEGEFFIDELLKSCGQCIWIKDESLMDCVTALSGSGPAYIFYMIEALTKAGVNSGLPDKLASSLARQTVIGSAALAKHNPDISAEEMRINVTSPGGTTQAALEKLMDGRFQDILFETLNAARNKSKDLNS